MMQSIENWKIFNIDNNNNKAQKLNNVTIKSVTEVKQKRITNQI